MKKKQKYDERLKALHSINPVNSTNISEWVTETNKQFNITLFYPKEDPIRETIKKTYEEKLEEGYIKNIAPIDGTIISLKKEKYAIEKEIDNLESGQLSKEEIKIRGNFCSFIAKSGLYLTEVCDKDGFKTTGFDDLQPKNIYNKLLNTQIDILLYQSGWNNREGNINTGQLDNELFKFYSKKPSPIALKASSPDNHLFTKMEQGISYFGPKSGSNKYIVNNAAPINNKYTFCPYSSILDGMSNCSSKTTTYERGNMNFKIRGPEDDNIYYNGKLSVNPTQYDSSVKDTTVNLEFEVGLNIKLNKRDNLKLQGEKKNINMDNPTNLEAHNVLKDTLVNILKFIETPFYFLTPKTIIIIPTDKGTAQKNIYDIRSVQDYILDTNTFTLAEDKQPPQPPSNIFDNLFNIFVLNPELFNKVVHSKILFKVVGDLFQEINSVCKYGGYTGVNYQATDDVIKYNMTHGEGDTVRGFFANDRPSGIRFLYMLQHAKRDSINQKAYGGYYSSINGPELIGAAPNTGITNGGFPIKKTPKSKQTRKHTKNKHPKKTKNAKRKNNKKTRKHKKKIIRRNTRKI